MTPWRARPLASDDRPALDAMWHASVGWLPQNPGLADALAGDDSGQVVRMGVFDGERLRGAATFWPTRQRGSTRWLALPFTPFGGLMVARADGELTGRDAERFWRDALGALASGVGQEAARHELTLAPGCIDARGLAWSGWSTRPHYNYVTRWQSDGDAWSRVESSVRRQARKAEAAGIVARIEAAAGAEPLAALWVRMAGRQSIDGQLGEPLRRLAAWLSDSGAGFVVLLAGPDGVPHCGALIGHDAHRCYYLAGASDPATLGSGASSLLQQKVFEEIERRGWPRCYDWVGANTPSIARFKSKFAPEVELLVGAWRESPWLGLMQAGAAWLGSLRKGNAASAPGGDD